jgi:serine/threonine protein kinase
MPDEARPDRLSRYVLSTVLGRGSQGSVYRARADDGRVVAVKILARRLSLSENDRARFLRETAMAMRLRHPNVIAFLDHGETGDGRPYLVTELVEGGSLAVEIARGVIDPARATAIGAACASALAYAHANGVVHRDVKPSNVLLGDAVKLIDFGLAWASGERSLTEDGTILGTPAYVAPEQVRGDAGPLADVYALGCVLYEALVGRPPFVGSVIEVVRGHLRTPPPPPSTFGAMPPALEAVVLSLLAKDPASRPTAAAVERILTCA